MHSQGGPGRSATDAVQPLPYLSVVVPAYDEAPRVQRTLERLSAYLDSRTWTWEIVVVNDGSSDRTAAAVLKFAATEPRVSLIDAPHAGKGAAVKRGMTGARGEWRFMCDADLSMSPDQLDRFFSGPGGRPLSEVSIGSREAPGARRIDEALRRHFAGRLFNYMVQALALPGLKDTQCGFKLFSARAVETVFPRQLLTGLGFDVELLFLTRQAGFKIVEIPIDWRFEGQSKVTLKKGAWGFIDILKIRVNQARGRYKGIRKVN